jgi:hypothetical protein
MNSSVPPRLVKFDPSPEIFATDNSGNFHFPLIAEGETFVSTSTYDEARLLISLWYPSSRRSIDLDRSYVEVQGSFDVTEEHWIRLAEIEPVVPPYNSGSTFDGWVVLPIFATQSAFALAGGGFHPRARLQLRASVYLVA